MDGDLVVLFYRWIVLRPIDNVKKRVSFAKKNKIKSGSIIKSWDLPAF